ncbi:hypothetical protein QFC21_001587 [Naganishia friedmannii]|uniref:Uncharacterized protein n=1 Tax=Naganishia friedmannii TaxID=89922 RepID=A0ACC2W5U1_9TREE|nr:hypothetical protein QFC21_001587 [Naganishia friedmannii]
MNGFQHELFGHQNRRIAFEPGLTFSQSSRAYILAFRVETAVSDDAELASNFRKFAPRETLGINGFGTFMEWKPSDSEQQPTGGGTDTSHLKEQRKVYVLGTPTSPITVCTQAEGSIRIIQHNLKKHTGPVYSNRHYDAVIRIADLLLETVALRWLRATIAVTIRMTNTVVRLGTVSSNCPFA